MITVFIAAALALPTAATAAPYDNAKVLYDAGSFDSAAAIFQAALSASPRNPALHYNLGNALLKSGKLGRASAAYQRAFDLDPRDAQTRRNLDFSLKRAGEELTPPGIPPLAFAAFTALSARELSGLHWLAAWLTLILAALSLLPTTRGSGPLSNPRRMARSHFLAAGAWIVFGLWWAGLRAALPPGRGVITADRAELRNGPGERFSVGYTAPEGRRVRVLSESGQWLEIGLLKEGVKGWIRASSVERL